MELTMNLSAIRQQKGKTIPFAMQTTALPELPRDWQLQGPLLFEGTFSPKAHHIDLQAELTCTIIGACSRCLKPIRYDLSIPVAEKLLFKQDSAHVEKPGQAFGELEETYWIYDRFDYDFSYVIMDAILTQLPLRPICERDCEGLCPICGQNRNEGDCSCEKVDIDPRWAGLAQLDQDGEV